MKKPTSERKAEMPKVVEDRHELLRRLIPYLDKFPRNQRFTLGERLETELLEVWASVFVWPVVVSKEPASVVCRCP